MSEKISDTPLLYDPMFAKKPPEGWEDSEKGGIFGKAVVKKTVFIIFLFLAIGVSLFFSFKALGKEKYIYEETDGGCWLSEFNGGDSDTILNVEYYTDENGQTDTTKSVTGIRTFAVCCNESLELIYIGKDVTEIQYNCFYTCKNLKAVLVSPENETYVSVDGVLYTKDMTEIILHPMRNNEYRTALAMKLEAPSTPADGERFLQTFHEVFGITGEDRSEDILTEIDSFGATYEIPDTVTAIAPYCFAYCDKLTYVKIPDTVKEFGQMAFFKCASLESIYIPDGVESIGSDAVSYCSSLNYIYVPSSVKTIGHHAFYGCMGCDKIYVGAQSADGFTAGESWLPKQSERSTKDVEVMYAQERRVG